MMDGTLIPCGYADNSYRGSRASVNKKRKWSNSELDSKRTVVDFTNTNSTMHACALARPFRHCYVHLFLSLHSFFCSMN